MTASKAEANPVWFALINKRIIITPRREVPTDLLRLLACIGPEHVLVRDYQSPHDEIIPDCGIVDLGKGNVFYTEPRYLNPHPHSGPPKLAFAVNDRAEVVVVESLPLKEFLELFNLPEGTRLVRDFESPHDEPIHPGEVIWFKEGPSFVTHGVEPKHIDVAIVTTGGSYPHEGYERLPVNQPVKDQLDRAAKALKLGDVSSWVAKVGTRVLDQQKSYAANGLSGKVDIDFGPPSGGGGACR
jgi:hypothetical protein